ncbi:OpgC domain-containing protein [Pigmentiphaga soli]|uniref:OpgC domain-containing protein n=1 Tax=Pigmentiphaga soli TaxID=1007095 RepID=A0ABP8GQU5_9BURK
MAAPARHGRLWELDALRGLMLVLMLSTHLPTQFAIPTGQPFGFVSAAEGFVMLSAYMAGRIYTQYGLRDGIPAMRRAFLRRALVIYLCQAASLLFLFTIIAALGITFDHPAARNLMSFYLAEPFTALWAGLLLIYNPPLLDILPLYVTFMLLSPWVLAHAMQRGWRGTMIASGVLWLASQFGISELLYQGLAQLTGLPVPWRETGAFETFAWQLLWVLGLWLGSTHASGRQVTFPPWTVGVALVVAPFYFVWRHLTGQEPFELGDPVNLLFDKWRLGPMRLLDFFALLVLVVRFAPWMRGHVPRIHALETLGAASLPVFCAHLVVVLLALALMGEAEPTRPLWIDLAMFGASLLLMWLVAKVTLAAPERGRRAKARAARPRGAEEGLPPAAPAPPPCLREGARK